MMDETRSKIGLLCLLIFQVNEAIDHGKILSIDEVLESLEGHTMIQTLSRTLDDQDAVKAIRDNKMIGELMFSWSGLAGNNHGDRCFDIHNNGLHFIIACATESIQVLLRSEDSEEDEEDEEI